MSEPRADLRAVIGAGLRSELAGLTVLGDTYQFEDEADGIVQEIAAAGYELVDADRLDRLIAAAEEYEIELEWRCGAYLNVSKQCTSVLEPGDLER